MRTKLATAAWINVTIPQTSPAPGATNVSMATGARTLTGAPS